MITVSDFKEEKKLELLFKLVKCKSSKSGE